MNIPEIIKNLQTLAPEIAETYCIVNGTLMNLNEIQNMGYNEFSLRSKNNMPLRLYRYYPNLPDKDNPKANYSLQALKENTVFLQTPIKFDDVYDSDVHVDYPEYEHYRLLEYCLKCGIIADETQSTQDLGNQLVMKLWNFFTENGTLDGIFTRTPVSKMENLSNESFCLSTVLNLHKGKNIGLAVSETLRNEYNNLITTLQTTFRTTCFTTTPFSQLMWGSAYADCHHGFCIEYTILPTDERYRNVYFNLFPMIYCKTRPSMSKKLISTIDQEITMDYLWNIYSNGVLRKSMDWAFQNEWRLILPPNSPDLNNYNAKFFPITKVFLGNRMPYEKRKEIIDICNQKSIPYVGVRRNPSIYEMEACNIKCEDCPNFQSH